MPPKAAGPKWTWETDDGAFADYQAKHNTLLEKTFQDNACAGVCQVTFNGGKYEFDFTKMTQKNLESGKVRRIARNDPTAALPVAPPAAAPVVTPMPPAPVPVVAAPAAPAATSAWHWTDDKGGLKPFSAEHVAALEAKYLMAVAGNIAPHKMTIVGQEYEIDFVNMTQLNTSSHKRRSILRMGDGITGPAFAAAIAAHAKAAAAVHATKSAPALPDTNTASLKKAKSEESTATSAVGGGVTYGDGGAKSLPPAAVAAAAKSQFHSGGTKVVKKGNGVVDPLSGMAEKAHVLEEDGIVWQCMLNQTNVGTNNNKYYVIQALELDTGAGWYVFTRWGRVGSSGQSSLDHSGSAANARSQFASKFQEKTKNNWLHVAKNHDLFVKHPGKYHLMDIDFGGADEDDKVDHVTNAAAAGCSLLPQVQRLLKMIGSKGDMEKSMKELEIDTAKMPLGKISKKQIKEAFAELKNIEAELKKPKANSSNLVQFTSNFYTLIPHDFGFMHPPVIQDLEHLKRKMDLLEMLADLEVASKLLSDAKKTGKHPLDASYQALNCQIAPIAPTTEEFKRIQRYVEHSHGKTHHIKVTVEDVLIINRAGEETRYRTNYGTTGNKMMLWHGSRTTNFMGILSQGLRIAPPEAPVTGYMFGKGVYFADCVTKSANYCHSPSEGLLLLCEVALGKTNELTAAKYMDKPMGGTDSTIGVGRMIPDPAGDEVDVDGVRWPCGKLIDGPTPSTALLYNEMIVYDVSQLKMRYLVRCKFGKK